MAGYDPREFEERWYRYWEDRGDFMPAPSAPGQRCFSIVIPPPNVTGSLHMGHALNNTLQDILVRYHRMLGEAVLWVPGTDHAGIATQNVVERQLMAEGKDRHALGREAFVERVWSWKEQSGGTITRQLRRLGVSCDWSMERFTMDEGLSRAVREVFVSLFEQGLITRDRYLINWCPRCKTALSDIEVEHEDRAGNLWHLRYPLSDGSGVIVVATTRPETMLGDTAVAVHPDDDRYRDVVGKSVRLPVLGRDIPVIADPYVQREFGSGAVKITPGHDPNDYEMGLRHALPMISVMNEDGTMSEAAGEYAGTSREECRAALVARFESDGTLDRVEPHKLSVGTCYRCHSVVEPLLSTQWFVQVRALADDALRAVDDGRTRFVPSHWEKTYRVWMENIRPWCISRQLWWGHRIPAWYCDRCEKTLVSRETPAACPDCRGGLRQDEDVLDTWFSSALWPFSTMGWPDRTEALARFYPTSVLVTAFDIIFFWVARMMMMGLRFMGEVPFRDVYIHAIVRDAEGQKMSKSKGNVIDPLTIIDEFGADAFRFTLAAFAAMGRDVRISTERIAGYRNFVNKLWNAARFVELKREGVEATCRLPDDPKLMASKWIRARLASTIDEVRAALESYRFNDAAGRLYQFIWHEYCDWYIEIAKLSLEESEDAKNETLAILTGVLEHALRLLHPIAPFVTEELWQSLPSQGREVGSLMRAEYPRSRPQWHDPRVEEEMEAVIDVVRTARNVRAEMNIAPKTPLDLYVSAGPARAIVERHADLIKRLARIGGVHLDGVAPPRGAATAVAAGTEISIPIAEHVDLAGEATRLEKEIAKLAQEIGKLETKLGNVSFVERAPVEVVEKDRARLQATVDERATLQRSLERVIAAGGAS